VAAYRGVTTVINDSLSEALAESLFDLDSKEGLVLFSGTGKFIFSESTIPELSFEAGLAS
jgi:hypothetical protein